MNNSYTRNLIEANPEPTFSITTTGEIIDANNAAIQLLNQPLEELMDSKISQYFTEATLVEIACEELFKNSESNQDYPITFLTTKGSKIEVAFNGNVFQNELGIVQGAVIVTKIIKEHKRVEKELKTTIKMKILVIEDIPIYQLLTKKLLNNFGFESDVVSDGKTALEKLKNSTYDLILMDMKMSELGGHETTKHIREKLKLAIPIIALTTDLTTIDFEKCKAVGMNDFSAKPLDEQLLYTKIIKLVTNHEGNKITSITTTLNKNKPSVINLAPLERISRGDHLLQLEIIDLLLEQTPALLILIEDGLKAKNRTVINSAVHKLITSLSIMGMSEEIQQAALNIQKLTSNNKPTTKLPELITKLDLACKQACLELIELKKKLKN